MTWLPNTSGERRIIVYSEYVHCNQGGQAEEGKDNPLQTRRRKRKCSSWIDPETWEAVSCT